MQGESNQSFQWRSLLCLTRRFLPTPSMHKKERELEHTRRWNFKKLDFFTLGYTLLSNILLMPVHTHVHSSTLSQWTAFSYTAAYIYMLTYFGVEQPQSIQKLINMVLHYTLIMTHCVYSLSLSLVFVGRDETCCNE